MKYSAAYLREFLEILDKVKREKGEVNEGDILFK